MCELFSKSDPDLSRYEKKSVTDIHMDGRKDGRVVL